MIERLLRTARRGLNSFLFFPAPATGLALCRLIFFGWLFCWYFNDDLSLVALQPSQTFRPILLLRGFGMENLPSRELLLILTPIWKGALLMACFGLMTRFSSAVACLLGFYLLGLTHSFYKINHSDGALIFTMAFFAMSRAGDVFSLDRWLAKSGGRQLPPVPDTGEYRWPIQMARIVFSIVFCWAGITKLINGGTEWMFSENLNNVLWYAKLTRDSIIRLDLSPAFVPAICVLAAAGTVVVEILTPVALFSRKAAMVLIPSLFFMQAGITYIMGDDFTQFASLYLFWLPWLYVPAGSKAWVPVAPTHVMLFDGGCGMCRRTAGIIRKLDVLHRIEFRDVVGEWNNVSATYPSMKLEEALLDMHVVSGGRFHKGFYAYRSLAWAVPLAWPLIPLLYVPGVPAIGQGIYRHIAGRRLTQGCAI